MRILFLLPIAKQIDICMETKYMLRFISWLTHELTETGPHTFEEMRDLFYLHINQGETTSIYEIEDNGDKHREENS